MFNSLNLLKKNNFYNTNISFRLIKKKKKISVISLGPLGFYISNFNLKNFMCFFEKKKLFFKVFYKYNFSLKSIYKNLLWNNVLGILMGFFKSLFLEGIGFKIILKKFNFFYLAGYSHLLKYVLKSFISIFVWKKQIILYSINFNKLSEEIKKLCNLKIYLTYKIKGIFLKHKVIKLKVGKASYK